MSRRTQRETVRELQSSGFAIFLLRCRESDLGSSESGKRRHYRVMFRNVDRIGDSE